MKRFVVLLFCPFLAFAQAANEADSSSLPLHQKSMLLSAIVPGAGQVYNSILSPTHNHATWKLPLIYTGLAGASYFLVENQREQKALKTEYQLRSDNNPNLNPKYQAYDDAAVLSLYRQYLDWRDLSILGLFAVYALQIADAGAEAHFVYFDVSPQLSMSGSPFVTPKQIGFQLKFDLHTPLTNH
ncbi:MAG: hypothetical protein RLZZ301_1349 [Bacteroidota bacterium]|jgi:hypothetical protein